MEEDTNKKISLFQHIHFQKRLAFAIACLLMVCIALPVPQVRASIMHLGTFFYESVSELFGGGALPELDQYSSKVLMTAEDQGITIQLNEVVVDNTNLVATYTVQYEEEVGDDGIALMGFTTINGKSAKEDHTMQGKKIAEHQYQGYIQSSVGEIYTGGKSECEICFTTMWVNKKEIAGNWEFTFTLDDNHLIQNTKNAAINTTLQLRDGKQAKVKDVKSNEKGTYITTVMPNLDGTQYYFIAGKDQKGNMVYFVPFMDEGSVEPDSEDNIAVTFTMFDQENKTRTTVSEDCTELELAFYTLPEGTTELEKLTKTNITSEVFNVSLK
ncbi:MAG: DUF4179 domain-containing protein [bacterium]|nr:DUF4179 domain-containing protein [bacterium]